jgi:hypothetical protein
MGHDRRQILWLEVTTHPTTEWIANQLTEACGWEQIPRYLIRDRYRAYGEIAHSPVIETRTRRYRAPPKTRDVLSVVRSWADCTINMAGCDLRKAQLMPNG